MAARIATGLLLQKELLLLSRENWVTAEPIDDNMFQWMVSFTVQHKDSMYYGAYLKAIMTFPEDYPISPPAFKFTRPLYHPNIFPDGTLCISILHPPGDDAMSGEVAAERWTPALRVETILLSILSLLDDAEISSPANVDAAVVLRTDPARYRLVVSGYVAASQADKPEGFEMPVRDTPVAAADMVDPNFSVDSDAGSGHFGGSDSEDNQEMAHGSGGEKHDEDVKTDSSSNENDHKDESE